MGCASADIKNRFWEEHCLLGSLDAGSYPPQLSPRGTVQGRLLRPDSSQMGSGTRGVILVTQARLFSDGEDQICYSTNRTPLLSSVLFFSPLPSSSSRSPPLPPLLSCPLSFLPFSSPLFSPPLPSPLAPSSPPLLFLHFLFPPFFF